MRVPNKQWAALAALLVTPAVVQASTVNLVPVYAIENTGVSFTGSVAYTYDSVGGYGLLTWSFTNTSTNPPFTASYLTGFAWDSPGSMTYTIESSTHAAFALATTSPVNVSPFGHYDNALAVNGKWEGGGTPSDGIA